jgi:small subunit ribosomal protein S12e
MSDAGDAPEVEAPAEVEVAQEAPKGKMSVEDALQASLQLQSYSYVC